MAANSATDERKVADNIENLMPDEFVLETQWLFAQDCLAAHDDRVLEAAALDQIFLNQRLDVFVVNKRPRRRDLALKKFRHDIGRQKLRETIVRPGLRA